MLLQTEIVAAQLSETLLLETKPFLESKSKMSRSALKHGLPIKIEKLMYKSIFLKGIVISRFINNLTRECHRLEVQL